MFKIDWEITLITITLLILHQYESYKFNHMKTPYLESLMRD